MVSEWTSVDVMLLNYDAGPDNLFWDAPIPFDPPARLLPCHVFPISDRRKTAVPLLVLVRPVPASTPIESSTPGYVKLLLPPRQSRGVSCSRLAPESQAKQARFFVTSIIPLPLSLLPLPL